MGRGRGSRHTSSESPLFAKGQFSITASRLYIVKFHLTLERAGQGDRTSLLAPGPSQAAWGLRGTASRHFVVYGNASSARFVRVDAFPFVVPRNPRKRSTFSRRLCLIESSEYRVAPLTLRDPMSRNYLRFRASSCFLSRPGDASWSKLLSMFLRFFFVTSRVHCCL